MNESVSFVNNAKLQRVKAALEKNYMQAHIVETAAEVPALVQELLAKGDTVANGGSMSLVECGVMSVLRSGEYNFLDREAPGVSPDEIYRKAFSADAYLASANAITETGEILEVDGRANRVAAIAYGPASVILVVGVNKVVEDLAAARRRVASIAAPANTRRLQLKTPCAATGLCIDCNSPGRICCTELVLRQQREKDRIKVILVNEALGY